MLKPTFIRCVAILASVFMAACGGGGGSDAGGGGGGTLGGAGSSQSPCAPNLCVTFAYGPSTVARLLTGSIKPTSTQALAGYSAHYSLTGGALPQGMSLDGATGAIHGTPTTNGFYDATVKLTVSGYSGSLSTHLAMEVIDPMLGYYHSDTAIGPQDVQFPAHVPFFLVGTALKDGALSLSIPTSNGETLDAGPSAATQVTYAVIGAQGLPPGLALDPATGAITGTPTQPGVWLVQVQAVATASGGSTTFTGWAPISVGPVIQEYAGQPAAAPVQIAVHAAPGVKFTGEVVTNSGFSSTDFTYDESTNVMTVTPAARPAGTNPGISESALVYWISAPNGDRAVAGYVEVVN